MATTVLVTGATGKTGRRLIPKIVRRGLEVRAASRTPGRARPGITPVRFDWTDASTYGPALAGVDAVYLVSQHLADHTMDPSAQVEKFVELAAASGVRRIVQLSAMGIDQAPDDEPLRKDELAVERSGIPSTTLRPGAFMQNFSENHWFNAARKIREYDVLAMPYGEYPMSFVAADDIAEVAGVALAEDGHEGKGYPLTGPEAITLVQVAEHITAATGRLVRYVDTGPGSVRVTQLDAGIPADFAEYLDQMQRMAFTSGGLSAVTDDVETITGRPATTFAEFALEAAGAWIR